MLKRCQVCGERLTPRERLNCVTCGQWAKRAFKGLTRGLRFGAILRHICPEDVEVEVVYSCD